MKADGDPEGKDCANLFGYPKYAKQTGCLHQHYVKEKVEVKILALPAATR